MMKTERLELTEQEISGEQKLNEKQIEKIKSLLAMLDFDLSFEN